MNVLVTGGAGFIGSHLAERLLFDGHKVTVLDDFSTGRPENLNHLKTKSGLHIYNVNVSAQEKIQDYFPGVDWVFHLAARADIIPSIVEPKSYHSSNVNGTVSVLESSRSAKVKRFVYIASSSCYGIPDVYPTPETAPSRPEYPYALTKYVGELYALHWSKVYRLPVISLRLFNVYGPRSRTSGAYGAVFGVFLAQKYHKKPFTVVGDGTQTRDFIFVSDVVDAIICAAQSSVSREVFNVGSGNTYSVNRIAELLGGDVVSIPKRPGEPDCTHADISKIRRTLNWQPKVSLETGVKILLENIEYWKDAPVWSPETISRVTKNWFEYLGK